ncbi:MAG: hypothetical protein NZ455_12505 [Bacteroidia bacterium]|nr:hypothetical protein [Bacteroidia bacterium]MDW8345896.1 hypothetical protein [Bacteroidia bacterium]
MYKNQVQPQNPGLNCVRGMQHAVRQYGARAQHRSAREVRNAPTRAQRRGTPKNITHSICRFN